MDTFVQEVVLDIYWICFLLIDLFSGLNVLNIFKILILCCSFYIIRFSDVVVSVILPRI